MTTREIPKLLLHPPPQKNRVYTQEQPIPSPVDEIDWIRRQVLVCDFELVDDDLGTVLYVGKATSLGSRLHPRNHPMWWAANFAGVDFQRLHLLLWSVPPEEMEAVERWLIQTVDPLCNSMRPSGSAYTWREPDLALPALHFHPHRRPTVGPPVADKTSGIYAWIWLPLNGAPKRWRKLVTQHHPRGSTPLKVFPALLSPAPDRTALTWRKRNP